MNRLLISVVSTCVLLLSPAFAQEPAIKTMLVEVSDNRTTGKFFAGAEVKLSLIGESLSQMRGVRSTLLTKAVDDTGKNLVKNDDSSRSRAVMLWLDRIERSGAVQRTIKLENPARRATMIKELTGTIELLAPARDPQSVFSVKNLAAQFGKPLNLPALRANGIEMTVLNKVHFDALRKAQEAKLAPADGAKAIGNALRQMFSGFIQVNENDLAFILKDPNQKLADIELLDGAGKPLKPEGRTVTGELLILSFDQKLPDALELSGVLVTAKSVVKIPFTLRDIALP
jgi:hypothetical protein